jgi:hypothetical protein
LGFIYPLSVRDFAEAMTESDTTGRIVFVVMLVGIPALIGALTAQTAAPHSPRAPGILVAAILFIVGIAAYVDRPDLVRFLGAFVAPWTYLIGVELHARRLKRRALRQRYEPRPEITTPVS